MPDLQIVGVTADLENILIDVSYVNPPGFPQETTTITMSSMRRTTPCGRANSLGRLVPNGTGADGDGNGIVQTADYAFWKARYGNAGGSGGGSAAAVPEPQSVLLLVLAGLSVPVGFSKVCRRKPG